MRLESNLLAAWERIPLLIRALLCGFAVMYSGIYLFELLEWMNDIILPQLVWAPFAMIPVLWLYWEYIRGRGWPQATSEARRRALRGHLPPRAIWGWTAVAGIGAIVFALDLIPIWQRIIDVQHPPQRHLEAGEAWWVQAPTLVMIAIVAGVSEESGTRGYLQNMVARRHGLALAVLLSAAAFTVAHFNHAWGPAMSVPFFVASIWFGLLAHVSGSIVPMILTHTCLNLFSFGRVLFFGPRPVEPLLVRSGLDAGFWFNATLLVLSTVAMIWALKRIATIRRSLPVEIDRR